MSPLELQFQFPPPTTIHPHTEVNLSLVYRAWIAQGEYEFLRFRTEFIPPGPLSFVCCATNTTTNPNVTVVDIDESEQVVEGDDKTLIVLPVPSNRVPGTYRLQVTLCVCGVD